MHGPEAGVESLERRIALTANLTGDFGRATFLDGVSGVATALDVAIDPSGNRYVVGTFTGAIDIDPGVTSTSLSSAGLGDIFVAKYGTSGSLAWARAFGGVGADGATSVAVDGDGNVLVAGEFQASVDFDPGIGTAPVSAIGNTDAFVAKFTPAGALAWVKAIGGSGFDAVTGVAVGPEGKVVASGTFMGTVDLDPDAAISSRTTTGNAAGFVVSLHATGGLAWAAVVDGTSAAATAAVADVAIDASGDIFAVGNFLGTIDVDPGVSTTLLNTAAGDDRNSFAIQLAANGSLQWARQFTGTSVVARSVAIDAAGNRFVGGSFVGSATVHAATLQSAASGSRSSAIVTKWASDGSLTWARRVGDAALPGDQLVEVSGLGLSASGAGGVAVLGTFNGGIDFDSGAGLVARSSNGQDVYLARLSTSGDLTNVLTLGGSANDYAGGIAGTFGTETVTGRFQGEVDFDPGPATAIYSPVTAGSQYAAIVTLGQPAASVPSVASGLVATAANRQVSLSWTTPTSDGGAPISDYRIAFSANGGVSWTEWPHAASTATSAVVTGLVNGIVYRFRVAAENSAGRGSFSAVAVAVPRPQLPSAPAITSAVAGIGRATVAWSMPAANGAVIVGYRLERSSDNGATWTAATAASVAGLRATVLGLANGTRYMFRVAAINAVGRGAYSANAASFPVTPVGLPGAPRIMSALPMNGQVNLWWQTPAASGGGAITDYVVQRSTDDGKTWVAVADPVSPSLATTVSGLVNGRAYRFRVAAINAAGRGAFSMMSPRVIPLVPTSS